MNDVLALERASALCDLGRWDDAVGRLKTILSTDPDNGTALCLMAQAQLGNDAYDEALSAASAAISQNPTAEWPCRLASLALRGLGRDDEAKAMARMAVRLAPHTSSCHIVLAQVLAQSGSDLGDARAAADRAVSLAPHSADSHIAVGMVAAADSRIEDATAAYQRALALEPDNTVAHNELARLSLGRRRFGNAGGLAKAAGGFASAVRADPRAQVSRSNLDLVLHVFLARTAYGIFLVALVAIQAHHRGNGASLLRILPPLLLVLPAFFALRFVTGLDPALRRHLVQLLRSPFIAGAVLCDAVAAISLVLGAVVADATAGAFFAAGGFGILARLILWRETKRKFPVERDPHKPSISNVALLFIAAGLLFFAVLFLLSVMAGQDDPALLLVGLVLALGCIALLNVVRRRKR